jgi:hypothetical protein
VIEELGVEVVADVGVPAGHARRGRAVGRRGALRAARRQVDGGRPALGPDMEVAGLVGRQLAPAERGQAPGLLLVEG